MRDLCARAIDWDATGSMMSAMAAWVAVLVAICAAIKAASSYEDWRRQKLAERHIAHAETILAATYRAQYNLIEIRQPLTRLERQQAQNKLEAEGALGRLSSSRESQRIDTEVYLKRVEDAAEGRLAIYRAIPYAKAFLHQDMEQALLTLHGQFKRVAEYAIENDQHNYRNADEDSRIRGRLIREALSYDEEQPRDEIGSAVADAISTIESHCLSILRPVERRPKSSRISAGSR